MAALRGPRALLWRWWPNPLRRRSDRIEAWTMLAVALSALLAGTLGGLWATRSVELNLARERDEWRPVIGVLAERAPGTASGSEQVWAEVRWPAADGPAHRGQTRVDPGSAAGTPVTVWTDLQGRMVTRPATEAQASLRAGLIGVLVGTTAALVPLAGGRLLSERLQRRRLDQWDTEWERVGPQWRWKTG
ncbi:hypothetical protein ACFU9Y_22165 [Streptomyces sp. NPDC057621]|uniref:Uncharacterized protein n=1 Tax=Streptomyces liliiviolaceus TaxID=2823109 RepID=A0A941B7M9_9ACTN|nr:hypothetical protein [Streptomyces liliiviolaceus]MBQ0853720.1 hypothetical protein [Streptomyces liliiviolaceus]